MSLATALRECGGANYETFERHTWCQRSSNQPVIGVGRPPALWALARRAAACCGTIASPNGTGRERCLGSWVLAVHCAPTASVGSLVINPRVVWRSPPLGGPLPPQSCCLRCDLSRTGGSASAHESALQRIATAWPSLVEAVFEIARSQRGRGVISAPNYSQSLVFARKSPVFLGSRSLIRHRRLFGYFCP